MVVLKTELFFFDKFIFLGMIYITLVKSVDLHLIFSQLNVNRIEFDGAASTGILITYSFLSTFF